MNPERVKLLRKFIEDNPQDPFNLYALALEYLRENPEESHKHFEQLLTDFPDYVPTYYQAAQLCHELDLIDRAQEIYELGIKKADAAQDTKAREELKAAYLNFQFEEDI